MRDNQSITSGQVSIIGDKASPSPDAFLTTQGFIILLAKPAKRDALTRFAGLPPGEGKKRVRRVKFGRRGAARGRVYMVTCESWPYWLASRWAFDD